MPASNNDNNDEFLMKALGKNIREFDSAAGTFFDTWFERYATLFEKDAKNLSNAAKVRLLLRKLNNACHDQYLNTILLNKPNDFTFKQTVERLIEIYGKKTTIFNTRYHCITMSKQPNEDFRAYAARVNKQCEDARIGQITADQFKCLMFVSGLSTDVDIRTKLLSLMDHPEKQNLSLHDLITETQRLVNLKQDVAVVNDSNTQDSTAICAVSRKPQKQSNNTDQSRKPKTPCWFCGAMHYSCNCEFRNHKCQDCGQQGHKGRYCNTHHSKQTNKSPQVKKINGGNQRKHIVMRINGIPIKLQLDTASDITIISEYTWRKLNQPVCQPTIQNARTANGNPLRLLDEIKCIIQCNNHSQAGKIFITDAPNLNVLGTDWFDKFGLGEIPINAVCTTIKTHNKVHAIQSEFADIFTNELSRCTKTKVKLHIKSESRPAFRAKRPVAYAAIPIVDQKLDRLQKLDIISSIKFSGWAAPIVVARKSMATFAYVATIPPD